MSIALLITLNLIFVLLAATPVLGLAVSAAREEGRTERQAAHPRGARAGRKAPAHSRSLPASATTIR
jgi:hypothetical protein